MGLGVPILHSLDGTKHHPFVTPGRLVILCCYFVYLSFFRILTAMAPPFSSSRLEDHRDDLVLGLSLRLLPLDPQVQCPESELPAREQPQLL